jgi:hypothetical protein
MEGAPSARDAELLFLALLLRRTPESGQVAASAGAAEQESFYRAVRNYYRAGRDELRQVAASVGSSEEVAVVFHLARHAALEVAELLRLRETGTGWAELARLLHLSRESFYVPLGSPKTVTPGAPYRSWREKARQAWSSAGLTDPDIVNLVNLKFACDYYGCQPEHVIALRATGWSFAGIHALFRETGAPAPKRRTARKKRSSQR